MLLLGGLVLLLHWINFPPSVLPPDNILDFSFYRERWQTIRQGLETLTGGPEELVSLAETVGKQCRLIAAGGALAAAALAVVQCRLARKRL